MASDTLTGSRIRERRLNMGLRQAELAERIGISGSYLNLIEHNRRRIGGKVLVSIAQALNTEPAMLTEGAGAALVEALRDAASDAEGPKPEMDRLDEFAGRFPGWAATLAAKAKRVEALERTVSALTDRLTHDPHLAANLHEMLTTVTAIRSTASILAEPGEIEPEWQARFHRNINDDSARLTDISQALVDYLDTAETAPGDLQVPQEEVDAVLTAQGWYMAPLEAGAAPSDLLTDMSIGLSPEANALLAQALDRYSQDAAAAPEALIVAALHAHGADPLAVHRSTGLPPDLVMRRIAALAPKAGLQPCALAICDGSGQLVHRQSVDAFPLPRFGAGCAMLPLYRALSAPHQVLRDTLTPLGLMSGQVEAYACAVPIGPMTWDRPPLIHAHMLIVPVDTAVSTAIPVGVACRVCTQSDCPGRSEPSVLARGH